MVLLVANDLSPLTQAHLEKKHFECQQYKSVSVPNLNIQGLVAEAGAGQVVIILGLAQGTAVTRGRATKTLRLS